MKMLLKTICYLFIMLGAAFITMAQAQTTAFTYQGRFSDSTVAQQPTNGTYTMTFRLFNAATGGNQIPDSSTAVTSMVNVVNGIFTIRLDFGAAAFSTTQPRYLEIEVGSTVLAPRQEITATPFANRTANAAMADSLSANCVGCVTNAQINSIDGGKVTGNVANATTAQNSEQLGGTAAGNFVQSGSNAFVRNQTTAQNSDFNITGTGSIGGNVGIGTTATATEALRVVGSNGTGNTNGVGGAGETISLQAGNGSNILSGAGGAGASVSLQSGSGGTSITSNISGGAGASITLQTAGGGSSFSNSGGSGAGILLQAGNGGGGPVGGSGGSIMLQPGSRASSNSPASVNGNVLLAPTSGNVGIGTTSPTSKLSVNGDLTVTGTINGTLNTTNFIRNQTTQQTGDFNISGNGAIGGDLTVGGTLNASLGQSAATVFGTNSLTVGRATVTSYTLVPGLRQTIDTSEITDIYIATDGGIRTLSTTSDGVSVVEMAILLDGDIVTYRRYIIENDRLQQSNVNWSLSLARIVLVGSHTIEVRARSTTDDGLSNANVSSGSGDFMQGKLTVITIKR